MNTHIVRVNDRLDKIALIYNLSKEEIVKNNSHINDWNHLIPGTKIKLPIISEMVDRELDNTEPFIEEYYPKLEKNINEYYSSKETEYIEPLITEVDENINITSSEKQIMNKPKKMNNHYSLPYYYNGYPYYGYYGNSYGPYSTNNYIRLRNKNKSKKK